MKNKMIKKIIFVLILLHSVSTILYVVFVTGIDAIIIYFTKSAQAIDWPGFVAWPSLEMRCILAVIGGIVCFIWAKKDNTLF